MSVSRRVQKIRAGLASRRRKMLDLVLAGKTYKEIGDRFKITPQRVQQLVKQARVEAER